MGFDSVGIASEWGRGLCCGGWSADSTTNLRPTTAKFSSHFSLELAPEVSIALLLLAHFCQFWSLEDHCRTIV